MNRLSATWIKPAVERADAEGRANLWREFTRVHGELRQGRGYPDEDLALTLYETELMLRHLLRDQLHRCSTFTHRRDCPGGCS